MKVGDCLYCKVLMDDNQHIFNVGDMYKIILNSAYWVTLRNDSGNGGTLLIGSIYEHFETVSEHRKRIIEDLL